MEADRARSRHVVGERVGAIEMVGAHSIHHLVVDRREDLHLERRAAGCPPITVHVEGGDGEARVGARHRGAQPVAAEHALGQRRGLRNHPRLEID